MKNRNSSVARPTPTHLSGPSSVVGTGPALGAATLANGTWAACIASPRVVSMPGGAGDGLLDGGEVGGGDGLVDQQGDVELVDRAGRDFGARTVLSTPKSVFSVLRW